MTLPELNRRLLAEPLVALVAVPASLPNATEQHFPDAVYRGGALQFANGSRLHIMRGSDARPGSLAGLSFDVAVVLTPWPASTMAELRMRLLRRGGVLVAPFEVEAEAVPSEGPSFASGGTVPADMHVDIHDGWSRMSAAQFTALNSRVHPGKDMAFEYGVDLVPLNGKGETRRIGTVSWPVRVTFATPKDVLGLEMRIEGLDKRPVFTPEGEVAESIVAPFERERTNA